MLVARLIISGLLFVFFLWGAGFNARCLLRSRREGPHPPDEHHPSMLVFLPGLVGVVAMRVSPYVLAHRYAWLPLLMDPGCALAIGLAFCMNAKYLNGTSVFRRKSVYHGQTGEVSIMLEVFDSGWYRIVRQTSRTAWSQKADRWRFSGDQVNLQLWDETVVLRVDDRRLQWQPESGPSWLDDLDLELVRGKPLSAYKA